MRILVVDEEIPFPLNSGKRLRTFNLLKNLVGKHDIFFVCRKHEENEKSDTRELEKIGIKTVVVQHSIRKKSGIKFYIALIANLFSKFPYSVESHYSKVLLDEVKRITHDEQIDLIHCEWTPYAVNLSSVRHKPTVVIAHNVESMIWKRNFEVEKNILKKAYIYLQWKKMESFEGKVFNTFSRSVAVSEQDRKIISNWMPLKKIDLVPNGVDVDYFTRSVRETTPFSLVFTGSMDWRPNVDGIIYFLDEIWPLIKQKFPECTFTIVGRRPMEVLKARVAEESAVELTGTVDDVRPYMERSSVYVVPLRVGGGSRLKILEALSMCKPVVSTTVGAEGLDLENGKELMFADTPTDFAEAIEQLFVDQELRMNLGRSGRERVENKYQWKKLSEELDKSWESATII